MYESLRGMCTSNGVPLDRCIRPGVECPPEADAGVGLLAGDAECYDLFRPIFEPVLVQVHRCPFPRWFCVIVRWRSG